MFKDGAQIVEKQVFDGSFAHTFQLGQHTLTINENGENFELKIDNVSFSHIMAQDKVKKAFVFENGSEINQSQPK